MTRVPLVFIPGLGSDHGLWEVQVRDLAEEMRALIPGARLEIIPGAGHLPPIEKPEAVTAVLRAWLTG